MLNIDINPVYQLLRDNINPQEMAERLEEIEEQYISYLLQHADDGVPPNAESQVYYLRLLKKAFQKVKVIKD